MVRELEALLEVSSEPHTARDDAGCRIVGYGRSINPDRAVNVAFCQTESGFIVLTVDGLAYSQDDRMEFARQLRALADIMAG